MKAIVIAFILGCLLALAIADVSKLQANGWLTGGDNVTQTK